MSLKRKNKSQKERKIVSYGGLKMGEGTHQRCLVGLAGLHWVSRYSLGWSEHRETQRQRERQRERDGRKQQGFHPPHKYIVLKGRGGGGATTLDLGQKFIKIKRLMKKEKKTCMCVHFRRQVLDKYDKCYTVFCKTDLIKFETCH